MNLNSPSPFTVQTTDFETRQDFKDFVIH